MVASILGFTLDRTGEGRLIKQDDNEGGRRFEAAVRADWRAYSEEQVALPIY